MKNIKKIFLLLLIVLVVLIGILLFIYLNPINREIRYIYNDKREGQIKLMPENVSYFFGYYNGQINQRSLYKALDLYINDKVEKYYKELQNIEQEGISKYYKKNFDDIYKELGLENESEFNSFIKEIKKLKTDSLVPEKCTFYPQKATNTLNYLEGVILIKYNNNIKVAFKIRALKSKDENRMPITLLGDVDNKYYDYEYIPPKENKIVNSPGKVIN